jgi:16S rRNA (cytosine1402-N4)-methyltransferase
MVQEIVELFGPVPPGTVLDGTVGGGGHAEALLDHHAHLSVLGLDQDEQALAAAGARLARFGGRVRLVRTRFDRLGEVWAEHSAQLAAATAGPGGGAGADLVGALFDLGVSSPQIDQPERGFSYRHDAPLDMRMDQSRGVSVATLLKTASEDELVRILRDYGEEPSARRIARAIIADRLAGRAPQRTGELVALLERVIPAPARRRGGHPAKRTFQALRIAVNEELDVLAPALDAAIEALVPGGRLAVLAYHSGEDRIVKARLRHHETGGCQCPPQLGCRCGARRLVRPLWRSARKPGAAEVALNSRAASARLRAAVKLDTDSNATNTTTTTNTKTKTKTTAEAEAGAAAGSATGTDSARRN